MSTKLPQYKTINNTIIKLDVVVHLTNRALTSSDVNALLSQLQ